jgi:hypothetical protein
MIMADPKYIAALILGVGVFIALPAVNAAKPPKPVDELEGRVTELEGDVAVLDSEVSGLSGQVNENTADIDDLKSQPPVSAPHLVVVDSTGQQIAIVQQVGEGFSTAAYAVAWFEIAGRYVPLVVYPNLIKYGPFIKILFPGGSNCTGTPYVLETDPDSWLIPTWRYTVIDGMVYEAQTTPVRINSSTEQTVPYGSGGTPVCVVGGGADVYPMLPIGQLPPSTPPYRIEVR